jgi:hypothetical protein
MKASEIPFGINLLFFFIFKKHKEGIEMSLSVDAERQFCDLYDQSRIIIRDSVKNNIFINSICGKFPTQLLRLSGLLQNYHEAFDYIVTLENPELNSNFVNDLDKHLHDNISSTVNLENILRAFNLLEYFIKTKLLLSGFDFDSTDSLFDILAKIRDNVLKTIPEENVSVSLHTSLNTELMPKIVKWILLNAPMSTKLNEVNQRFKCRGSSSEYLYPIFELLQNEGIVFR